MFVYSGTTYIHLLFIYLCAFTLFYFFFKNTIKGNKLIQLNKEFSSATLNALSYVILIFIIGFILLHFYTLGFVPIIAAYYATDILETAKIRHDLSIDVHPLIAYGSSFVVRSFIPFFLLYFFVTKRKFIFRSLLIISVFYCIGLLQKSFITFICLPIILYCLIHLDWKRFILFSLIPLCGFVLMVMITNPQLRGKENLNIPTTESQSLLVGSYNRIFLIPGKVVAEWFSLIPQKYPYLYGKGYHFLNPNTYVDYSKILYEELFPQYAKLGLAGTVNVASFVYEYSNFGILGLVLSALVLSFIFLCIELLFVNNQYYILVLNALPIILLSSAALSTMLFSGGWVATLVLFLIFRKKIE